MSQSEHRQRKGKICKRKEVKKRYEKIVGKTRLVATCNEQEIPKGAAFKQT